MARKKIVAIITAVCIMFTGCEEADGKGYQDKTFKINTEDSTVDWYGHYHCEDMEFIVWVDQKTGVNYIVGIETDSKGYEHYVMTERYNADGSLYVSEVAEEE